MKQASTALSKMNRRRSLFIDLSASDRLTRLIYSIIITIWTFYLYLSIALPLPAGANFGLSQTQITLLRLTVALPYLFIWLLTTNAFSKVHRYSQAIGGSREAPAFRLIALGLLILLSGLVMPSLFSNIRSFVRDNQDVYATLTIIINYFYIIPNMVAFWLFLRAGRQLTEGMHTPVSSRLVTAYMLPVFIFAFVWLDLIFSNPLRTATTDSSSASYFMRDSLIVLTIVLPALVSWFVGILSIIEFQNYRKKVKGLLYRRSLKGLVWGILGIIVNAIILESIISLGSSRLIEIGLGGVLGIVYIYLLIQGVSFYFIARGASLLTKLESV